MTDRTPTRSLAIALQEERRTMREGYAFLDEKCLLLAGEMLRQLRRRDDLQQALVHPLRAARDARDAALARHGLHGLQVHPPGPPRAGTPRIAQTLLLGVPLHEAAWPDASPPPAPFEWASPEARQCAAAWQVLLPALLELAALDGNLARLHAEYRRTVRRVRALQDVLLPEVESSLREVEDALEGFEQDEAATLRQARGVLQADAGRF